MRAGELVGLLDRREIVLGPEFANLGYELRKQTVDTNIRLGSDRLGGHEDTSIVEKIWAADKRG